GKRTVLVFDESQHLTADLLEELRLLGNLEGNRGKALQVVLLAQLSILETLSLPSLSAFNQRLTVRPHLEPLDLHESADYLAHGLRAAGGYERLLISDEAITLLARGARGIPRLLNRAANKAVELARIAGEEVADAEAALEALSLLDLGETDQRVED